MDLRWGHRSLRARLTAAATAAFLALLVAAAALLVWRVHAVLLGNLDAEVSRQATTVAAMVGDTTTVRISQALGQSDVIQVVDAGGRVLAASADIEGEPALFTFSPAPPGAAPVVQTAYPSSMSDTAYRVAAVSAAQQPGYRVYVGLSLAQVDRTTAELIAASAAGIPALTVALAGITWLLAGRALHPVELLRRQAADIPVTDLHHRVAVPPTGDELSRLAVTLNDLLARLEDAQRQQRRFIADAAHELRSPVAAIQVQLETADVPGEAGTAVIAESVRLSHLVDDLLALARLDARPPLRRDPLDLDDLTWSEVTALRQRSTHEVDSHGIAPVRVIGDQGLLTRMIRNLLDNADRYADRRVTVSVLQETGCAVLTVADDGPGIPEADRTRVFERFTRLDGARSRDAGGMGLGLAIVRDIVEAHGGAISISGNHPGARFTVRLPEDLPADRHRSHPESARAPSPGPV